jgi:hypothetical protein
MLYDQREFVQVDAYGIDPLLDVSYEAIEGVETFTTHTVNAMEQFNPGLISYNAYRTIKWWRAIMVYNGLDDIWEITQGAKIKIPNVNEMTTRLQRAKGSVAGSNVVTL